MSDTGVIYALLSLCGVALVLFVQAELDERRWRPDIERDRLKREALEQALLRQAPPPAE